MANSSLPVRSSSSSYPDEPDELNEHVHDPGDPDGLVATEQRKRWRETHSTNTVSASQRPPYRHKRLWPAIIAVIIVLAAAAFGSYWLGSQQAGKKQTAHTAQTQSKQTSQQQSNASQPATTTTKHYDSSTFTLGFDYLQTWKVSDTPAKLTVTSPAMQLATGVGAKTSAQVVVTIQNQQSAIPGFPAGGAVAALNSDHLTYKQPSAVQRAQTYMSYLSYTGPTDLDAIYITGDSGYQPGQQVPMSDIVKGNPLISVSFNACSDENCTSPKPVTLSAHAWQSAAASKDVANLVESLVLQG
ncbi:MAG TPA: hypothetical protein VGM08_01245 [Candidatus Saccharimonadales bacterium]|jgi:cytoskeletal protein RodZ